jgi:hypothetical protein
MGKLIKKVAMMPLAIIAISMLMMGAACDSKAQVASENLSKAADSFEINRRIVFFNGITDTYLLEIQGLCSIQADSMDDQIEVTCKDGRKSYKKHFLGLSDNVSYFVEQISPADVDVYHYRVIFRPETIIPDIDTQTSGGDKSE